MASRKPITGLFLFVFLAACSGTILAEDLQDDPMDLNEKSNTELISMERDLKERIGKEPDNTVLYLDLSAVYSVLFDRTRKKNSQSSEWLVKNAEILERVVMMQPDQKIALYNLGVVYKRQGKMERAREELRRAIRSCDPATDGYLLAASWMQIGSVYEEQGFFDEASDAYEKALDHDYGNEEIRNAIKDLKERKAEAKEAGSPSSYNFAPSSMLGNMGPAARSYDPMSGADTQQQGMEQELPALTSLFSQKGAESSTPNGDDDQSR